MDTQKKLSKDAQNDIKRLNKITKRCWSKFAKANDLEFLEQVAKTCKLCDLYKTHTNLVFGVGNPEAKIMFIGEAPGANEDLQGEPFVGRAGKLLNSMMQSIGLKRGEVYITNILKCRPPNNRSPKPEEIKLCAPCLLKQIELIKPKIIIALGLVAARFLLNTTDTMKNLRGKVFYYGKQKSQLVVTYHPAFLLRNLAEKSKAEIDFLMIKKLLKNLE